ncbi:MAG: leucine-rich repeat domain-containing protein [Bacteroidales bacterium]|nr:leucine-rich repeat domain-containing protein [Bacteroidales bacterium]MBP3254804.1 leucine-rich repeat domain-containing protein [Bacteroidales bacterium]
MKHLTKIILAVMLCLSLNAHTQTVGSTFKIGDYVYKVTSNVYPNFEVAYCGPYLNVVAAGTNSITVPSTVTYNGDTYTVTSIESVGLTNNSEPRISFTIPNTVKYIHPNTVNGIRTIILESGNTAYVLENGLLMSKNKDRIVACEVGQTTDGYYNLTVPSSVKVIEVCAFRLCEKIQSVSMSNVTEINKGAFQSCSNMTSAALNEGVVYIGDEAFYNCSKLKQITIPKSVTTLGTGLFYGCDSLKTMYYNAKKANENATNKTSNTVFYAPNLDKVIVGDSVELLPVFIFDACTKITSVNFPNSLKKIGDFAFRGCNRITSLSFPENLEYIGWNSFSGAVSVKEVTIQKGVTHLGYNAFENTTSLKTVHFNAKHFESDGDDYSAGFGWINVTTATIGDSVEVIPEKLFTDCKNLKTITIPQSVTKIGNTPLYNCTSLDTVYYNATNAVFESKYNEEGIAQNGKIKNFIIAQGVQTIPNSILNNEKGITEVVIPNSVKTIGDYAFNNCGNLLTAPLPDSVVSIGKHAFSSTAISELIIPKSVTTIGCSAFSSCPNLTKVIYNPVYIYYDECFEHIGMFGNDTALSIVKINDSVEYIPHYFLKNNKKAEIILPKNLRHIGIHAFSGTNIKELTLSNKIDTLQDNAFVGCDSLQIINYNAPSCTSIMSNYPDGIFNNCNNIKSLIIGENITSLPSWLFKNCTIDTIYSYPLNAPVIGYNRFYNCKAEYIWVPCTAYDSYHSTWWTSYNNFLHRLGDIAYTNISHTICQGEKYIFCGDTLTKSGEYTANLLNKYECDSIVTLTLTVNPTYDTLIQSAVKSGDTYTLNGFNVKNQGSFIQELKTINGCDSIINLELFTIETDTVLITDTLTLTQYDTVTLHDTTILTQIDTVTLYDTITNEITLYDTVTLTDTLYVYDTVTLCSTVRTYIYATINTGENYSDYGFDVKEAGTHTQILQTEDGCDSIITLYLQVTQGIDEIQQDKIIIIYPNPAKDKVTIKANGDVTVFNSKGQTVKTIKNIKGFKEINIADLESGVYYIKVGETTKKLIIK